MNNRVFNLEKEIVLKQVEIDKLNGEKEQYTKDKKELDGLIKNLEVEKFKLEQ
jgi:hypothetical protein